MKAMHSRMPGSGRLRIIAAFAIVLAVVAAVACPQSDAVAEDASSATATIQASCKLEGQIIVPGLTATVTLEALGGAPVPDGATSATFDFGSQLGQFSMGATPYNQLGPSTVATVSFTEAGTYTYRLTETDTAADGITCGENTIDVTVGVVADDAGALSATVEYPDGRSSALFTLAKPVAACEFSDVLVGLQLVGDETCKTRDFTFVLTVGDDNPNPDAIVLKDSDGNEVDSLTAHITVGDGQMGDVLTTSFEGSISISKASSECYSFYVKQVIPESVAGADGYNSTWVVDGVTYDRTSQLVSCQVLTDTTTGELGGKIAYGLSAALISDDDERPCAFQDVYTVLEGTTEVDATKVLEGRGWTEDDAFAFKAVNTATGATAAKATATASDHTARLKLKYLHPGSYAYAISEVAGTDANMDYDTSSHTVSLAVSDNGYGIPQAVVTYADGSSPVYTNTYRAPVALSSVAYVDAEKILTGRDLAAGAFEFVLAPVDDASAAVLGETVFTNGSAAAGQGSELVEKETGSTFGDVLGALSFGRADAGKTYSWTLSEAGEEAAGYARDDASHALSVSVGESAAGDVELALSIDGTRVAAAGDAVAHPSIVFTNAYFAKTTEPLVISGIKKLDGETLEPGEFTFDLVDATGSVVATATNASDGAFAFEGLSFDTDSVESAVKVGAATRTAADGAAVYVYRYTVAEDTSNLPGGVTATHASYPVEVTVTDAGDGTMTAAAGYPDGSEMLNTYATNKATIDLSGVVTARCATPGITVPSIEGAFTYDVAAAEGAPLPSTVQTVNGAAGAIDFGSISYTLSDLGGASTRTFAYTITQTGEVAGFTCDNPTCIVSVTVTNDGEGRLAATMDGIAAGPDFTFDNVYTIDPSAVALSARTLLEGADIATGEFTVAVTDETGAVVATAANDADGDVAWPALTFDAPGTYTYRLHELAGDESDVTYDDREVTVTVTVVQDEKSDTLVATVSYDAEPVFVNVYKKAVSVVDDTAQKLERTSTRLSKTAQAVPAATTPAKKGGDSAAPTAYVKAVTARESAPVPKTADPASGIGFVATCGMALLGGAWAIGRKRG